MSSGGSDQVTKLTQLSLPGGLVEELDQVNVGGVRAEALLEDKVDGGFQHEGIVDGNEADALLAVPAGLTTAGDGAVHNIITHQEESLQKLGEPTQDAQVLELFIGEGLLQEGKASIGNRETPVQFATRSVNIERLSMEETWLAEDQLLNCAQFLDEGHIPPSQTIRGHSEEGCISWREPECLEPDRARRPRNQHAW